MFIGELFVGNPPQKIRGVFDTGSSNTWIINKKTDIGAPKQFSYDDAASKTCKKTS
jgi:pepsin A